MACAHARDVVRRALAVLGSLEAACAATHTAETEGRPGVPRRVPCEQGSQVRATSRQLATCRGRAGGACEARLQLAEPAEWCVSGSVRGARARHGPARGAEPLRLAPAPKWPPCAVLLGSRSGESVVGGGHDDAGRGSRSRGHLAARSEPAASVAANKTAQRRGRCKLAANALLENSGHATGAVLRRSSACSVHVRMPQTSRHVQAARGNPSRARFAITARRPRRTVNLPVLD